MNINSLEEIEEMVDNLQKELDIIGTSKYIDSDDGLSAGELSESEFTKLRIKSEIDEKKRKEFFQFAGIYSVKTVLLPRNSERVKNISLISMDNKYNYKKKIGTKKPKFVELFEWPGIYKDKPTELPGANMCQIMEKALDSFSQLKKEFNYRNYALSMLKIPESLFFVTDMFWLIFLNNYQKIEYTEMSLFDRMSINYVKFLKESMDYSKFRKRFMNDYASFVSTTIYAAFYKCFPDSFRLFNDDFKQKLANFVYNSIYGFNPSIQTWYQWNYTHLEGKETSIENGNINSTNKMISNNILPQYETNTSLFDVNSNSPLIENYMKLTKKYKNVGTANYFNFVEQTPINKNSVKTYKNVRKEIQRNIKNMDNDLDKINRKYE